jgi:hypothetical protein
MSKDKPKFQRGDKCKPCRFKRGDMIYKKGPMEEAWLSRPDIPKTPDEIPATPEQLKEFDAAWDDFNLLVERYREIHADAFQKGLKWVQDEEDALWRETKAVMERFWQSVRRKMCACTDCLNLIPLGKRSEAEFCSQRCRRVEKERKKRRR